MKKVTTIAAAALAPAAVCAWGDWVYEGQWDSPDGKLTATMHNYKPATKDNVSIGGD